MTNSPREHDSFDNAWREIVDDLSDITIDEGALADLEAFPEEEPAVVSTIRARGPRDWTPESEEDDHWDGITLSALETDVPTGAPGAQWVWLAAGALIIASVLAAFFLDNGKIALACGASGFIGAGIAGFLSSPRSEGIDPFDDGARV